MIERLNLPQYPPNIENHNVDPQECINQCQVGKNVVDTWIIISENIKRFDELQSRKSVENTSND